MSDITYNDQQLDLAERYSNELQRIEEQYGSDPAKMPAGQAERHRRLDAALRRIVDTARLDDEVRRQEQVEKVKEAAARGKTEPGFGGQPGHDAVRRIRPWDDLDGAAMRSESSDGWVSRAHDAVELIYGAPTENRNSLADAIDTERNYTAAAVVALSNPAYETAFAKVLRNPQRAAFTMTPQELGAFEAVEVVRAALDSGTGSGGYAIPLSLNPNVAIANAGVIGSFRQFATVKQTATSPYRLLTSAGATAEWKTEGAQAADGTPAALAKVDVPLWMSDVFALASYELLGDSDLATQMPRLLMDARDILEQTAFAVGNGSSQPAGVVTRAAAVTASRVSPTTGGTFTTASAVDVYKTYDALPPRARASSQLAWIGNQAVWSIIRQQTQPFSSTAYWANVGEGVPERLLGVPRYEASGMDASMTTGSNVLLVGNFERYTIVDHIMGMSLEYFPALFGTNQRATAQSGWFLTHRVGAECQDASQFRVLKL